MAAMQSTALFSSMEKSLLRDIPSMIHKAMAKDFTERYGSNESLLNAFVKYAVSDLKVKEKNAKKMNEGITSFLESYSNKASFPKGFLSKYKKYLKYTEFKGLEKDDQNNKISEKIKIVKRSGLSDEEINTVETYTPPKKTKGVNGFIVFRKYYKAFPHKYPDKESKDAYNACKPVSKEQVEKWEKELKTHELAVLAKRMAELKGEKIEDEVVSDNEDDEDEDVSDAEQVLSDGDSDSD